MKRTLALCLALLLCLTGCAALLEREYTVTAEHMENPPTLTDGAYRVETYPALRSALLSYVEEGRETGLLRFPTTYGGNLEVDLEKARRQLMEEDPLGNYALEDVTFHISKIIAYYEAELAFTYKADIAELTSLSRVSSQGELTELLGETLEEFGTRLCVRLSGYPEGDEGFFATALADAYGAHPTVALGRPEVSAQLYPKSGSRRVAVLELSYPRSFFALERQKEQVAAALEECMDAAGSAPDAQRLYETLKSRVRFDAQAGPTVYDALVTGQGDAEALALSYKALCQRAGILCRVVRTPGGCYVALTLPGSQQELWLDMSQEEYRPMAPGGEGEE